MLLLRFMIISILAFAGMKASQYGDYKYETVLDHRNLVRLKWNFNSDIVQFKLTVLEKTYPLIIGFGFSNHGEFNNADFGIFEINSNKEVFVYDANTDSNGVLHEENNNDYVLNDYWINKNEITIYFERKLKTCHSKDYVIERGTVHILHFLFNTKHQFTIYDLFDYNFKPLINADSADMKQTQLIKSTYFDKEEFSVENHKNFEVRVNKIKLPSKDTTYWCHVYKLDSSFDHKHHITAFESAISESSKGIVHHMELFHCISDPSENMKHYSGPCDSEAKPKGLLQCRKVIAAWAMGAGRFVYPSNVGGVIGGPHYSPYLVLEIHFDNQNLRSDIIDSSGIKIFYQGGFGQRLRQYDAGILEIGLEYNPKNSIPPQHSEFHLHGHCLGECTYAGLPKNGITIFSSQLHTHLTGRRVWTSQIRNNKEIRMLKKPVRVLPGDGLVNTCVYNTGSRRNMTFGGFSIRDEMCVNYMHYYPLAELEVCKSSISDKVLDSFFKKMQKYDYAETTSKKSVQENFNSIRWTPLTSDILSNLYDISPISFSCNSSNGQHIDRVYRRNKNEPEVDYFNVPRPVNLAQNYAPYDEMLRDSCHDSINEDYDLNY